MIERTDTVSAPAALSSPTAVSDIIVTHVLRERPSKPPAFEAESRAFRLLAETLATAPDRISQQLVDLAMALTGARSAGLSLLDNVDGEPVFRWVAVAGEFGRYVNGTLPRHFSPCGMVIDRNEPMLLADAVRFYPYVGDLHQPAPEILLAPFMQDGQPRGTVWVVQHDSTSHFDAEDLRILQSLTTFASAALNTVGLVGRLEDDKARTQRVLKATRKQNRSLVHWFEQAPGFVALLRGPEHVFEMVNKAYYDLVGRRPLVGKPLLEALPEVENQQLIALLDEVAATRVAYVGREIEVLIQREPDVPPVKTYLDFVYQPIIESDGTVSAILVQGHDVTERRRSMELLKEADTRKDELLAVVAHELRNPLSPIRLAVQLLKSQTQAPEFRASLDVIDRQSARLSALVDDLLDAASIRAGKTTLRRALVPVQEIFARAMEACRPVVERHGHRLQVRMPDQSLIVDGDIDRLVQIIVNLLNNAAKYTPEGGSITLCAEADRGEVALHVEDTGIGIAAEMLPRIFDMFMQIPDEGHRSQGGLGIGLSLVRQLAELHGGRAEAKSAGIGQGSCFTIRLPAS